jgi:hypothetical protein
MTNPNTVFLALIYLLDFPGSINSLIISSISPFNLSFNHNTVLYHYQKSRNDYEKFD